MDRRVWAVGACLAGAALAFTFLAMTWVCGMMQVEVNEPGEPANEPECVSSPHPMAALFGIVAVGAAFAAWRHIAWVVVVAGLLVTATGLLFVFSMGFFGFPVGILIIIGGALTPRAQPPPAPTSMAYS